MAPVLVWIGNLGDCHVVLSLQRLDEVLEGPLGRHWLDLAVPVDQLVAEFGAALDLDVPRRGVLRVEHDEAEDEVADGAVVGGVEQAGTLAGCRRVKGETGGVLPGATAPAGE